MRSLYQNFPQTPGVYLMKNREGEIIYVGKAGNLKKRVSSYFLRANDLKTEKLVSEIVKIDYKKTDTVIEALILEADLIKKYAPQYNIKDKDDKSFLFVGITKEKFPRIILVRGKDIKKEEALTSFGPFTSASSIREALRIIRKIFPYSIHPENKIGKFARSCFDYEIGLCPGTCTGLISRKDYFKNIKNIKLFFSGQKNRILKNLEKEMREESKKLDFEKAEKSRRQIFALQHIQDVALISENDIVLQRRILLRRKNFKLFSKGGSAMRIEGYDISNISGDSAVGSMVVFMGDRPSKEDYRKFKIRTVTGADDISMLKEVLKRRFKNNWPLPNLILVDGGKSQVNTARAVLSEFRVKIPVVGVAKGPTRKKNEFIGIIPQSVQAKILIQVRNEAHRFAINYHRKIRSIKFRK